MEFCEDDSAVHRRGCLCCWCFRGWGSFGWCCGRFLSWSWCFNSWIWLPFCCWCLRWCFRRPEDFINLAHAHFHFLSAEELCAGCFGVLDERGDHQRLDEVDIAALDVPVEQYLKHIADDDTAV